MAEDSGAPTRAQDPVPAGGRHPPAAAERARTSPLALASLALGIAGWTILPILGAVAAVITGHLARWNIDEAGGQLGGSGLAKAGLVLGYVQIGLIVLGMLLVVAVGISLGHIFGSGPTLPVA